MKIWYLEHEGSFLFIQSLLFAMNRRVLIFPSHCWTVSVSGLFITISVFYIEQLSLTRRLWQALQRLHWVRLSWPAPKQPPWSHSRSPFISAGPNEPRTLTSAEILTSSNEGDAPLRVLRFDWHVGILRVVFAIKTFPGQNENIHESESNLSCETHKTCPLLTDHKQTRSLVHFALHFYSLSFTNLIWFAEEISEKQVKYPDPMCEID